MKKFVAIVILTISLSASSYAQPSRPITKRQVTAAARHQLDSLFHYLDTGGLYNGNILVAAGGKKIASVSIGYANLETKERLTEASPFELASVSKQFTAAGILRLVDAGKLKLDQKLETILPAFPYKGITIRNLLNHTGGLPDYEALFMKHWDRSRIATNSDVIAELTRLHPDRLFAPGTKWEYSNTGYAVLGYVIEKISGKSYADYMQEQVFAPLRLTHTFVYMRRFAPRHVDGYAYGYVADEGDQYKLPDSIRDYDYVRYLDGIGGDGSVNTTVDDLLAWDNAVRDRKLISAALWTEATTPPVVDGKSTGYGFGFAVSTNPERGKVLMHTGGWPGYNTQNVLYLDKDIVLIYLSNKEQSEAVMQGVWDAVKNIVFGKPYRFPEPLKQVAAKVDARIYSRYTGTYESVEMKGFELKIRTDSIHLFAMATGQQELEITPESETSFYVEGAEIVMEFKAEDGKQATTLILHQNGDHEFKRK